MRALALLLVLAGCSGGGAPAQNGAQSQDLESAAIARGLVRDPADTEIVGLYARDTDRLCIVKSGMAYRVGAFVDYGDRITCSGSGTVGRVGETLRIALGDRGCSFDARFDGDKISFPGALPEACEALCARRASYAGLEVTRMSESSAEAAAMRDAAGRRLCGD
ncbi:hypothetical protein [Sphingomonas hengshuiensis]|uniref:Lipoprotein n=1 Tax=Sphingomonas hengshuiensis TaxID=1609977 RepID=A0A7U4LES9_9SPHN|nr:hypothetical protein [Sphingomonas hengshuiensis]AJP71548.1 hypothetical protein TS85_06785 [Sphingomonas hengshuiensis]